MIKEARFIILPSKWLLWWSFFSVWKSNEQSFCSFYSWLIGLFEETIHREDSVKILNDSSPISLSKMRLAVTNSVIPASSPSSAFNFVWKSKKKKQREKKISETWSYLIVKIRLKDSFADVNSCCQFRDDNDVSSKRSLFFIRKPFGDKVTSLL